MNELHWQTRAPDLVADVVLYDPAIGGRKTAVVSGYGCPCFTTKDTNSGGWDARLQLNDDPFEPGSHRRVGFVFLSGQVAANALRKAGRFYLWEGSFIGEANVVS